MYVYIYGTETIFDILQTDSVRSRRAEGVIFRKSEKWGEIPPTFQGGLAFLLSKFLKKAFLLSRSENFRIPRFPTAVRVKGDPKP
jgi:hypothetical protein